MSKYQITLTPVDKFFFGGDMTFKVGSQDDDFNERYSSYIIQSQHFPQQTSLLGMLRFLILRNAGDEVFKDGRIIEKGEARKLIGGKSFSVNADHVENDFGAIKSLTHVRIREESNGQAVDLEFKPLYDKELKWENSSVGTSNFKEIRIPALVDYNPKKSLLPCLTDGVELSQHFVEDRRMGIDRDIKTGKTDKDALFKQISYRFNNKDGKQYCFVFEAEVDESIDLEKYSDQMVTIGGDNSQFIIGISKDFNDSSVALPMGKAVYALSPVFLKREEVEKATFAITQLMPFRFLESEMEKTKSYHILNKELKRSKKYELYAPGSIFYFDDDAKKEEFIKKIEAKKDFRQIGYNEFK